jgi:hypothetical protein
MDSDWISAGQQAQDRPRTDKKMPAQGWMQARLDWTCISTPTQPKV